MKNNSRTINIVSSKSLFYDNRFQNAHHSLYDFNMEDLIQDCHLKYDMEQLYMRSKFALFLFTKQFQSYINSQQDTHLSSFQTKIVSVFPGPTRTSSLERISAFTRLFTRPFEWLLLKSPEQGVQTTLYCILQDYNLLEGGCYYEECGLVEVEADDVSLEIERRKKLWNVSLELLTKFERQTRHTSESLPSLDNFHELFIL